MTELIWSGKYDDKGRKSAPVRIALPFQTIETVNESAEDRKRTLDMFSQGKTAEWRNRLIWGDKKYVLPSLLPEFAGKVNLIYIDPPFDTGADFSFTATIPTSPYPLLEKEGDEGEVASFVKEPSLIEQKAYRDTWGKGLDSYLQWFYETAVLLRELLAEDGSIYVHLDWHVGHYAKTVLDDVFGYENFRNEIIWKRTAAHNDTRGIGTITDCILYYAKSEEAVYNTVFVPYDQDYVDNFYRFTEIDGRKYRLHQIERNPALGIRQNLIYEFRGYKPKFGWMVEEEKLREFDRKGMLVWSKNGKPQRKIYLDEDQGRPITNVWIDISAVQSQAKEKVSYNTQKPEALLARILNASSNEGDLVLDCFCGSGTTAAVAEKLNRRWITCDLGRFAIHTTRKRLLQIPKVKPFVVQNLGKYERQAWVDAEFSNPEDRSAQEKAYRNFIIDLYHGKPISGYSWLHGAKAGRMIHIGSVDTPVSNGDVKSIVTEFWKSVGKGGSQGDAGASIRPETVSPNRKTGKGDYSATGGVSKGDAVPQTNGIDILGWDFAFDINETAKQQAAASRIDIRFLSIPHEVLEKKAVEQGDIKFYELAALDVKVKTKDKKADITLKDFVVSPEFIPDDIRKAISHWSQWVDYWALDWNYKEDTFHNEWQSYRTRKDPTIELSASHVYEEKGAYTVVVKVIDILGNDTTKMVRVVI